MSSAGRKVDTNVDTKVIPLHTRIHPSAIVHPKAQVGAGVEIGPYTIIGENVEIGEGTKIGAHCVIEGWTKIGRENKIYTGAIVGSEPQDLKFGGEKTYLFIGDNNIIRSMPPLVGERKAEAARRAWATAISSCLMSMLGMMCKWGIIVSWLMQWVSPAMW